jgi:HEAT repeat protein
MHQAALQLQDQMLADVTDDSAAMTDDFEPAIQRVIERIAPAYRDVVRGDLNRLRKRGVASWQDLVAVLNDRSAGEDRARAGWLLGRMRDARAFDPLASALHDPDPHLRAEAARSLGALGSVRAVPELLAALQADPDLDTRIGAAHSLGLLGDHRAVDPLLAKLADKSEHPRVRGVAAEALTGPREHRAVPLLITALDDPSVEVRFWAAFALGELGDPAALSALERLAQTDDAVLPGWRSVKDEAAAAIDSIRTILD